MRTVLFSCVLRGEQPLDKISTQWLLSLLRQSYALGAGVGVELARKDPSLTGDWLQHTLDGETWTVRQNGSRADIIQGDSGPITELDRH